MLVRGRCCAMLCGGGAIRALTYTCTGARREASTSSSPPWPMSAAGGRSSWHGRSRPGEQEEQRSVAGDAREDERQRGDVDGVANGTER